MYLSNYGAEFQGGRFIFQEPDNATVVVEPRKGEWLHIKLLCRICVMTSEGGVTNKVIVKINFDNCLRVFIPLMCVITSPVLLINLYILTVLLLRGIE